MHRRPLVLAVTALLVGGVALPAAVASAPADQPAKGSATSALELFEVRIGGHSFEIGNVSLESTNLEGSGVSTLTLTPLRADGTAHGERSVTAADSGVSVPGVSSGAVLPDALAGLASLRTPALTGSVADGDETSARAGASELGSLSVLGLPVTLSGSAETSSLVNGTVASGTKTLIVEEVALPSVADLLGALGLDLTKLPVDTLIQLTDELELTSTTITTAVETLEAAQAAIAAELASAQAAVDAQQAVVGEKAAELTGAQAQLSDAQAALSDAVAGEAAAGETLASAELTAAQTQAALDQAIADIMNALPAGIITLEAYLSSPLADPVLVAAYEEALAADQAADAAVIAAQSALASATSVRVDAAAAVAAAQALVDAAQVALNDAHALLQELLTTLANILTSVQAELDAVIAAVVAVLDETPLVAVDRFEVSTRAVATSASEGGQEARVVGGELQGVVVLGADVLSNVLGSSQVNLTELTTSQLDVVNAEIAKVTGILESVLSAVPGLSVPSPEVALLTQTSETAIVDGFGVASNSVHALKVTLPSLTIPAELAVVNAAELPGVAGVATGVLGTRAVGDILSEEISLAVGTLSEQARFQPAVTSAAPAPQNPPANNPPAAPQAPEAPQNPQSPQSPQSPQNPQAPEAPQNPETPTTVSAPKLPRTGMEDGASLLGVLMVGTAMGLWRRYGMSA